MLTFILVEASLERIPPEIAGSREAKRHAKRRGKRPEETLMDRSYHHHALGLLPSQGKRGRPDIVHFNLLQLLGSPLNKEGLLTVYVHTVGDFIISVNPRTRIPRNYDRFVGLIEQLFNEGRVPPRGEVLMELERMSFPKMCNELRLDYLIGLSRTRASSTSEEVALILALKDKPGVVVGGLPRGHFSPKVERCCDEIVSINREGLDSWVVLARIIYDYERAIGIPEKREEGS